MNIINIKQNLEKLYPSSTKNSVLHNN